MPCTDTRKLLLAVLCGSAVACGESEAERKNHEALTALAHRNRALSEEYSTWFKSSERPGGVTWQTTFDQYDKLRTAKESVLAEVRKVVPSPKYDCVIGLLSRSTQADIEALNSRRSYNQHLFNHSVASKRFQSALEDIRTSEYGGRYLVRSARDAANEVDNESEQVKSFKKASNAAAARAGTTADTLIAAIQQYKLLPSVTKPAYPVVTDTGADSLIVSRRPALGRVCQ